MSEIVNLSLETTLIDFKILKQNFKTLFDEKNVRFCGIKAIDKIIVGFHKDKTYYFVANQGMGAMSSISSIFDNFNLLYNENFSIEKNLGLIEYLGGGETLIKNAGSKFQYLELSEDITVREQHDKRPKLEDIPKHIQQKSDVIITIYRPEYYNLKTWKDGEPTENQIEFSILKNYKKTLGSERLYFDKESKAINSIQKPVLPKSWTNKMIKLLSEETN